MSLIKVNNLVYNVHTNVKEDIVYDNVICCNCGYKGLVNVGQEYCPVCNKKGCLSWQEPNEILL